MFGFSLATQIFQGSTQRTWNCVAHFGNLIWDKFLRYKRINMPRSRKRHHSRSRSRSRSHSHDRSFDKHKKTDSHEKDGKRRRLDDIESPHHKRSLSSENLDCVPFDVQPIQDADEIRQTFEDPVDTKNDDKEISISEEHKKESLDESDVKVIDQVNDNDVLCAKKQDEISKNIDDVSNTEKDENERSEASESNSVKNDSCTTPKKQHITPKKLQKKLESEKKRQQKQKEKEERDKQKQEEKERLLLEKQKLKQQKELEKQKQLEEKQKQLQIKQKEKEMKEEQKRKEKEEKEQKRKEKEEKEEQKRKEKELEKQKKQHEIEEKNREKQREDEKKQKTSALFVNFFKKAESDEKDKRVEKINSYFMPFQVKSDMRLPPLRRKPLSKEVRENLESSIQNPDQYASYLKDLKSGKLKLGKTFQTWPYEEAEDEIVIIEEDKKLGETICEDASKVRKMQAKFLSFHENRRPPYFGTWRKKSNFVKPRRPFGADTEVFNYEEDSDDDWEEEEQGESLDASGDEEDKDIENDQDDYEVDNDFFVPHGHLSDDEIDDEENARLSPESLKQKLKLLKDEFDEDMKSKTHKLKPRSIGCIWLNKQRDNVDEAVLRYLEPFAVIFGGQIEIKKRSDIFASLHEKKKLKAGRELPVEYVPLFLKFVHGKASKKQTLIEQFLTYMINNGLNVEVSKAHLIRFLKQSAMYKRSPEGGPLKNKFGWFVKDEIIEKYNVNLDLPINIE